MPRVSAVMPLYNGGEYLKESIQSIQHQTFTDWEFIIVNEFGSDPSNLELLNQLAKKESRIRVIQNETRLGLAESINVGIKAAQGEYIARVDVDDPSAPQRFQKQVEFLDSHPDFVLCGTLQYSVTPYSRKVESVFCEYEPLKASMLFGCEISHCSVMLRAVAFKKMVGNIIRNLLRRIMSSELTLYLMLSYKILMSH